MEPKRIRIEPEPDRGFGSSFTEIEDKNGDYYDANDPAIVQALAIASAAREAGMVDEAGRFRKILGTLPITADDVIVLPGAKVWPRADHWIFNDEFNENWTPDEESAEVKLTLSGDAELDDWDVTTCYSTPEAARSAASAAKGGGDAGS